MKLLALIRQVVIGKVPAGVDARTLTIADAGTCDVQVTVTQDNYEDWSSSAITVTVDAAAWTTEPRWDGCDSGAIEFWHYRHLLATGVLNPAERHGSYITHPDDSAVCDRRNLGRLTILSAGDLSGDRMTATSGGIPHSQHNPKH